MKLGTLEHVRAVLARIASKPRPAAWPPSGYFTEHSWNGRDLRVRGSCFGGWRGPWRTDDDAAIADCELNSQQEGA
jgi:hypothetical protein